MECGPYLNDDILTNFFQNYFALLRDSQQFDQIDNALSTTSCPLQRVKSYFSNCICTQSRVSHSNPEFQSPKIVKSTCSTQYPGSNRSSDLSLCKSPENTSPNSCLFQNQIKQEDTSTIENNQEISNVSKDLRKKFSRIRRSLHLLKTLPSKPKTITEKIVKDLRTTHETELEKCIYMQVEQLDDALSTLKDILNESKQFEQCSKTFRNGDSLLNQSLTALNTVTNDICTNLTDVNKDGLNTIQDKLNDTKILIAEMFKNNPKLKEVVSNLKNIDAKFSNSYQNLPMNFTKQSASNESVSKSEKSRKVEPASPQNSQIFQTLFDMVQEISWKVDLTLRRIMESCTSENEKNIEFKTRQRDLDVKSKTSVGIQYDVAHSKSQLNLKNLDIPSFSRFPATNKVRRQTYSHFDCEFKSNLMPKFNPDLFRKKLLEEWHKQKYSKFENTKMSSAKRSNNDKRILNSSSRQRIMSKDFTNRFRTNEMPSQKFIGKKDSVSSNEERRGKFLPIMNDLKKKIHLIKLSEKNLTGFQNKNSNGSPNQTEKDFKMYNFKRPSNKALFINRNRNKNFTESDSISSEMSIKIKNAYQKSPELSQFENRMVKGFPKIPSFPKPSKYLNLSQPQDKNMIIEIQLKSYKSNVVSNIKNFIDEFSKKFNIEPNNIRLQTNTSKNPSLDKTQSNTPRGFIDNKKTKDRLSQIVMYQKDQAIKNKSETIGKILRKSVETARCPKMNGSYPFKTIGRAKEGFVDSIFENCLSDKEMNVKEIRFSNRKELIEMLRRRGAPSLIVSKPSQARSLKEWLKERENSI